MTTMAAAHHFMEQGGKKSNHKPGYVKRGVLNLSKCSALVIIGKQKEKKEKQQPAGWFSLPHIHWGLRALITPAQRGLEREGQR